MRIAGLGRLRLIVAAVVVLGGRYLAARFRLRRQPLTDAAGPRPRPSKAAGRRAAGGLAGIPAPLLRQTLEKLGPTFVKLGQVLSLRPDFVGEELSDELSKLQSDVTPFPFEDVERIIREDLGGPPDAVFRSFDRQPVAAASLAQVHRAFLDHGEEVAVKVQRPGIRKVIDQDIGILLALTRLAERLLPAVRPYSPVQVVKEFADWTRRELDFAVEGRNADRFRFAFAGNPHIKVPAIYWDYTTSRVLTMEYIHGVRTDDLAAVEKEGLDRKLLALHGVDAQLQQILVDGFFHADPHPGNSFAIEGNGLCFYDFGMVGYLNEEQRRELTSCLVAFANKNIERFLAHFLRLARVTEASDTAGFEKDAYEVLSELFFSPANPSIAWIFFRLINKGAARKIGFPADLALFSKAIITTEAMGLALYPDFDFNDHLAPSVKKAFETYVDPSRLRASMANDLIDYTALVKELPDRARDWLLERGRRRAPDADPGRRDPAAPAREAMRISDIRTAHVCLLFFAFLAFVLLFIDVPATGALLFVLKAAVALFCALSILFFTRSARNK